MSSIGSFSPTPQSYPSLAPVGAAAPLAFVMENPSVTRGLVSEAAKGTAGAAARLAQLIMSGAPVAGDAFVGFAGGAAKVAGLGALFFLVREAVFPQGLSVEDKARLATDLAVLVAQQNPEFSLTRTANGTVSGLAHNGQPAFTISAEGLVPVPNSGSNLVPAPAGPVVGDDGVIEVTVTAPSLPPAFAALAELGYTVAPADNGALGYTVFEDGSYNTFGMANAATSIILNSEGTYVFPVWQDGKLVLVQGPLDEADDAVAMALDSGLVTPDVMEKYAGHLDAEFRQRGLLPPASGLEEEEARPRTSPGEPDPMPGSPLYFERERAKEAERIIEEVRRESQGPLGRPFEELLAERLNSIDDPLLGLAVSNMARDIQIFPGAPSGTILIEASPSSALINGLRSANTEQLARDLLQFTPEEVARFHPDYRAAMRENLSAQAETNPLAASALNHLDGVPSAPLTGNEPARNMALEADTFLSEALRSAEFTGTDHDTVIAERLRGLWSTDPDLAMAVVEQLPGFVPTSQPDALSEPARAIIGLYDPANGLDADALIGSMSGRTDLSPSDMAKVAFFLRSFEDDWKTLDRYGIADSLSLTAEAKADFLEAFNREGLEMRAAQFDEFSRAISGLAPIAEQIYSNDEFTPEKKEELLRRQVHLFFHDESFYLYHSNDINSLLTDHVMYGTIDFMNSQALLDVINKLRRELNIPGLPQHQDYYYHPYQDGNPDEDGFKSLDGTDDKSSIGSDVIIGSQGSADLFGTPSDDLAIDPDTQAAWDFLSGVAVETTGNVTGAVNDAVLREQLQSTVSSVALTGRLLDMMGMRTAGNVAHGVSGLGSLALNRSGSNLFDVGMGAIGRYGGEDAAQAARYASAGKAFFDAFSKPGVGTIATALEKGLDIVGVDQKISGAVGLAAAGVGMVASGGALAIAAFAMTFADYMMSNVGQPNVVRLSTEIDGDEVPVDYNIGGQRYEIYLDADGEQPKNFTGNVFEMDGRYYLTGAFGYDAPNPILGEGVGLTPGAVQFTESGFVQRRMPERAMNEIEIDADFAQQLLQGRERADVSVALGDPDFDRFAEKLGLVKTVRHQVAADVGLPSGETDRVMLLAHPDLGEHRSGRDHVGAYFSNPLMAGHHHFRDAEQAMLFDSFGLMAASMVAGNPDLARSFGGFDAQRILDHVSGDLEALTQGPAFDVYGYLAANPDVAQAVGPNLMDAIRHYLDTGVHEGRTAQAGEEAKLQAMARVTGLAMFDEDTYLALYPDVAEAVARGEVASGRAHYEAFGFAEQRMPFFDGNSYLAANPDVAEAVAAGNGTALGHFIQFGRAEGRPLFPPAPVAPEGYDETLYLQQNPDVAEAVEAGQIASGLEHFHLFGQAEGRSPGIVPAAEPLPEGFDAAAYMNQNPDILQAGIESGRPLDEYAIDHYLAFGKEEGRAYA